MKKIIYLHLSILMVTLMVTGCFSMQPKTQNTTPPDPCIIGQATMREDGSLLLRLRAEGPDGIVGHGELFYEPTHPRYPAILEHIGSIKPGQSLPVRCWDN